MAYTGDTESSSVDGGVGLSFSEDIQPGQRDHVDTVADAAPRAGRQDTGVPLSERQDGDQHPRVLVHPLHPL